jgi:hypothetical protein
MHHHQNTSYYEYMSLLAYDTPPHPEHPFHSAANPTLVDKVTGPGSMARHPATYNISAFQKNFLKSVLAF